MKTSRSKHYNSSRSSLPFEEGMSSVKFHNVIDDSPETAVLVGLITPNQDERKTAEYLDELAFLAETAGAKTIRRFTQKMNGPNSVTYLGIGKLQEIRAFIQAEEEAEKKRIAAEKRENSPWNKLKKGILKFGKSIVEEED